MGSRQNAWVVARSHTHEGMSWLGLRISAWDMMFKIVCLETNLEINGVTAAISGALSLHRPI